MEELVLDLRGEECPAPLVKVTRTLAKLNNRRLVVLTDIKECVDLIRETVENIGSYDIMILEENNYWRIMVRAKIHNIA